MLYGINTVSAALAAGRRRLHRVHLRAGPDSERLARVREAAMVAGVPVVGADAEQLETLCGSGHHQGVALECGPLLPGEEREALALAAAPGAVSVVLDRVEDPQNLGALVRSCVAFGVAAIVQPRRHAAPLSAAASRASAGLLESAPMYAAANLARFLDGCRRRHVWIAGTAADGETPLHRFDLPKPLVVVMGSEGQGLRRLVREACDVRLAIPAPGAESLNVASAAAVVLYEVTRPR